MSEQKNEQASSEKAEGGKKAPETFKTIFGEKIGMTQIFDPKGRIYGVSVIQAGPCPVLAVKTAAGKDGYDAVVLGFGSRKEKNIAQAQLGQFKKAGAQPAKHVREVRCDVKGFEVGQTVSVGVFKPGEYVDVRGTSKGKGFAGVMKRHNFLGLPGSHGASDKERSPGSLASRRSLGRVLPGQRMAGHLGAEQVCTQKIEVIQVDSDKNLIYVNGPVPGPQGGLVSVCLTSKPKKFKVEVKASTVKKDKMGNIIQAKKPSAAPKK
jgi:large subunit ribosomal protein L3